MAPNYCDTWTPAEWRMWIDRLEIMRRCLKVGWSFEDAMRHVYLRQFKVHDRTGNGAIDWALAVANGIAWARDHLAKVEQSSGDTSRCPQCNATDCWWWGRRKNYHPNTPHPKRTEP